MIWGIDALVAQLRDLRVQALEIRSRRDKPPKLPSRKELQLILDGLGAVLFPNRLGQPDLNDEGIDYFVGHTLENLLRKLYKQISRELHFIESDVGKATQSPLSLWERVRVRVLQRSLYQLWLLYFRASRHR